MATQILRMREVLRQIGVSRSTVYNLMAKGDFPKPIRIGAQAVGWRASDIEAWIASRGEAPIRSSSSWHPTGSDRS